MAKGSPRKKRKRLKKDARSERKEKHREKKERNKFLGEEIEEEKIEKQNKNLDKAIDELYAFVIDLNKFVSGYGASIQEYLKTKNPIFTANSRAYSERIVNDLNEIFEIAEHFEDFLEYDKDYVEIFIGDIEKENKFFEQERRIEKRQYRNLRRSAKEQEGLEEPEKEAIIQKRMQMNEELKKINERLADILKKVIEQVLEKDLEEIRGLLDHRKNIKKKWKKQETSWESLRELLNEIGELVGRKGELVINLKIRNRKITVANNQIDGILQEKTKMYAEKQALDKNYDQMLIKEEIEVSHEKDMGRIVDSI